MTNREKISSFFRKVYRIYARYEVAFLVLVVISIIGDWQVISELPPYVLNTVITNVLLVYITVEGILIGLSPQVKLKILRDAISVLGIVSLIVSVRLFLIVTFQALQLGYTSTNVATYQFNSVSVLFLAFVEFYAIGILLPPVRAHSKIDSLDKWLKEEEMDSRGIGYIRGSLVNKLSVSIGSKFNLLALGIIIAITLIPLGVVYSYAPSLLPALLVLVTALVASSVAVWNKLYSSVRKELQRVWGYYLLPIWDFAFAVRDSVSGGPSNEDEVKDKIGRLPKYGNYGASVLRLKLYPKNLVELTNQLFKARQEFEAHRKKINEIMNSLNNELIVFRDDRFAFRMTSLIELTTASDEQSIRYLEGLNEKHGSETEAFKQSRKRVIDTFNGVISVLDKFSSQNGINTNRPSFPSPGQTF